MAKAKPNELTEDSIDEKRRRHLADQIPQAERGILILEMQKLEAESQIENLTAKVQSLTMQIQQQREYVAHQKSLCEIE